MKDMLCIKREIYKLAAGELWEQKGQKSMGTRGAEGEKEQRV